MITPPRYSPTYMSDDNDVLCIPLPASHVGPSCSIRCDHACYGMQRCDHNMLPWALMGSHVRPIHMYTDVSSFVLMSTRVHMCVLICTRVNTYIHESTHV